MPDMEIRNKKGLIEVLNNDEILDGAWVAAAHTVH
jgi:hypothetical protein